LRHPERHIRGGGRRHRWGFAPRIRRPAASQPASGRANPAVLLEIRLCRTAVPGQAGGEKRSAHLSPQERVAIALALNMRQLLVGMAFGLAANRPFSGMHGWECDSLEKPC
jgi:hypothetical protein